MLTVTLITDGCDVPRRKRPLFGRCFSLKQLHSCVPRIQDQSAALLHHLWVSGEVYETATQHPKSDAVSRIDQTFLERKSKDQHRVPVTALIARPTFHLEDGTTGRTNRWQHG